MSAHANQTTLPPWHAATRVVLDGEPVGWAAPALAAGAAALAERLARQGLRRHQVVVAPVAPALGLLILQQALARLHAALLPVRADLPAAERATLIAASGAEWWWEPGPSLTPALTPARASSAAAPCPPGQLHPTGLQTPEAGEFALLVQTSGSSGAPRLAMLTPAQVLNSCALVNARLGLGPGDAWLAVLPRQHIGGLAIAYRCALAGATLVVQERFDVARVAAALESHRITHLSLVPALLERLLAAAITLPPSLRVVLLGGQALSPALARRAAAAGWPLYLGYGMTETCSQIAGAWLNQGGLNQGRSDASGSETAGLEAAGASADLMPLPGVELAGAPECSAGSGLAAEALRVRGPMLMAGYANPTRTPGVGLLADGWLPTADLACLTAAGGLRVLGRADGVLISGGVKIVPELLEARLAAAPAIGAVAVTAIPDAIWGQRLVALYTGSIRPAELSTWCRATLRSAERPRLFYACATLPMLASGKLDRRALAQQARTLVHTHAGPAD